MSDQAPPIYVDPLKDGANADDPREMIERLAARWAMLDPEQFVELSMDLTEPEIDGWTYGFSTAPRSRTETIIVILKDRERAWIRYNFSSPVLEVFWDASPDSEGWTTGGCDRLRDDELECWRRMPPRRAERAVEARGPSAAARPSNYSGGRPPPPPPPPPSKG